MVWITRRSHHVFGVDKTEIAPPLPRPCCRKTFLEKLLMVAPSPGLVKLNNKDNKELLGKPEDEPPRPLPADLLDSLSVKVGDDVTEDCLHGLTQRMISTKIDLQNKQLFADQVQGAGEREVARVTSLSLPYAGAWLTCAPIPALGLHMRGPEFVVAVKFRLGLNIYDKAGKCPSCGKESDELGDHGMVCGTGGESISRHNALRDTIFDTAASGPPLNDIFFRVHTILHDILGFDTIITQYLPYFRFGKNARKLQEMRH